MRKTSPAEKVASLDALYAELPTIECRGQCWDSCGRLPLLQIEQRRIAATGVDIPDGRGSMVPSVCPALTMFNQCGVYEIRPMICRLWGLADNLPCTFGCVPDGGRLTVAAGYEFLARAAEIDGNHAEAARIRAPFATPESSAAFTRLALANMRARDEAYDLQAARAKATGPVMYVHGAGKVSSTPGIQHHADAAIVPARRTGGAS